MIDCAFFGEGARLHHIGLAVRSIRTVNPECEPADDATLGVTYAFMRIHGVPIELLEPYGEDSPIAKNVRDGVKLLHLCFEVPDIEEALSVGRSAGFHCVRPPVATASYENRRVAWTFSKHYGLFELLERSRIDQP